MVRGDFRIGEWLIQPQIHVIRHDRAGAPGAQNPIKVEPKAMAVLVYLAEHSDEVVSKEKLISAVWADTFVTDDVLTRCISDLRRALDDDAKDSRVIQTIPRSGYRLVLPVQEARIGPIETRVRRRGLALAAFVAMLLLILVFALNVGGLRTRILGRPTPPKIESLAVLPLRNDSGDPEQEYFADGMTEALITELAKIAALKTISRTSVMQYKNARKPLPEIAGELKVDALVEGSVLRSGDRVRVTAKLVHAATDSALWTQEYERDLRDVLSLYKEVARAIAREIQVTLSPAETARLTGARPINPAAYEAYLQGRFHWNKRSIPDLETSLGFFQQAIQKEPDSAPAYAALADSYNILADLGGLRVEEARPKALAAAQKALEIDPTLGEAHTALAFAKFRFDWDWTAAAAEFRRAIELNPSYAPARQWYSFLLAVQERWEQAVREAARSQELDPLSLIVALDVGRIYLQARQYDRAIEEYRKAVEMSPNDAIGYHMLAEALVARGTNLQEAIAMHQKAVALSGPKVRPHIRAQLAYSYAVAGRKAEAESILQKLVAESKGGNVSGFDVASVYAALGQKDQAFAWLETAYARRDTWLPFLKAWPWLENLYSDPRFADLCRRVGLPEGLPHPPPALR